MRFLYRTILLVITLFSGASIASAIAPPINTVAPAISNIQNTTADLTATVDEDANVSYIVVTAGSPVPTAAQVKSEAIFPTFGYVHANGAGVFLATLQGTLNIAFLFGGTDYTLYFVAEDLLGNLQASAAAVNFTTANNAPTGAVTITGTVIQGQILTASNTLADADGMTTSTIIYQWNRAGVAIAGATASTYTVVLADIGQAITVTASYTDDLFADESVSSAAAAAPVNSAPVLAAFTTNGAVNDDATITAFANVTVTDANAADLVSVAISFTAVNGTLAGTGITGSNGSYAVTAATQATAQTNLRAAVFTPTAGQVNAGLTVITTFTLTPNDGTVNGAVDTTTKVTATSMARNPNVENTPALTISSFSNTGNQMGQSFTAPRTGALASINITSSVASTGATLKVYSGEGITGTLLHTQTIAVLNNTAVNAGVVQSYTYQAVPLDAVVSLTAGQIYTFDITATAYLPVFDSDSYAGGMQYNTGTGVSVYDSFFQLVINGPNSAPVLGGIFTTVGAINDQATMSPFSGVTLSDADGDMLSVNITYTAANGVLSGTGLSGVAGNYTVNSAVIATVQSNLQGLVFTPTENLAAVDTLTTFTMTPNDSTTNGASDTTTQVTTTPVAPTLTITADAGLLADGASAQVTFTLSEASTDFMANDISLIDLEMTNFTAVSATQYTATITAAYRAGLGTLLHVSVPELSFTDAGGSSNAVGVSLDITDNYKYDPGCAIAPNARFDPVLPLLALISMGMLWHRRKKTNDREV